MTAMQQVSVHVLHDLDLMVCETCESEIDVPDEHAELGVCRHCGIAFLLDVREARAAS